MKTKSELRSEILKLRKSLNSSEYQIKSQLVQDEVIRFISNQQIQSVHVYIAINGEVNTASIIDHCLERKIEVIAPRIEPDRQLSHWLLTDMSKLEKGLFSTLHPPLTNRADSIPDLILVPGVAFDHEKNRLGYGAGYYDRFLAERKNSKTLGLAFDFQIVEKIETEMHDIKLDAIVTDTNWIK
ncbi:MAG: 5-formyltetrahydrofolate cyclo-ligase [Calditrichaeota bacterium]|nr:5-formyltetrahydrofolate cyclo-ligase [Calditrichota bacterium]